jgi:alkyldihydroxyacetonephosphate synthase
VRRWNGWGDTATTYPLPPAVAAVLRSLLGPGTPPQDAAFADVVAAVPGSQLPPASLVTTEPADRVRHARGQSFPDLVALRSGRIPAFPDGVAYPTTGEDVRRLLEYARDAGIRLIPYGGGTSVVGHVTVEPSDDPVLTVDLGRLNGFVGLDEQSRLATFWAGVAGPDLEAHLRARGYTLGHFPQSFERSTLGGWIATRSSGQQSLGYGRIEHLFAGGRLEAPSGTLDLPPFPASAAGPDLRALVLGGEGRFGLVTEAVVRVTPLPKCEAFHAVFFPDWEQGWTATREIAQSGAPLSMARLSTPTETATSLALTGHQRVLGLMERALAVRGIGTGKCLLLLGFTGDAALVASSRAIVLDIARGRGGVHVGRPLGDQWRKDRFRAPYLRDELWARGYGVDTVETATVWSTVPAMVDAVETALRGALADRDERVHAFTHLSHVYPHGSSVYTTFLFRLAPTAAETLDRWRALKAAASAAIVAHGGTISHQHGVGTDHRPYLAAEKGPLGVAAIRAAAAVLDPDGLLNPGKLL